LLFCLGDDASIARHLNDRRDLHLRQQNEQSSEKNRLLITPTDGYSSRANVALAQHNSDVQYKGIVDGKASNDRLEDCNEYETANCEDNADNNLDELDGSNTCPSDECANVAESHDSLSQRDTNQLDEGSFHDSNAISTFLDQSSGPMKKGISVKDRKLIKKYGSLEAAENAVNRLKQLQKNAINVREEKSNTDPDENSKANPRGKKSKIKKINKKYNDQDEEDRVSEK